MMQMKEAYQVLQQRLQSMYEPREASQIADMVIEKITGYSRTERLVHHEKIFNTDQATMFEQDVKEQIGRAHV